MTRYLSDDEVPLTTEALAAIGYPAAKRVDLDKLVRVPREWDETCRECHGSGRVHKREWFRLWTQAEFSHADAPGIRDDARGRDAVPADAVVCTSVPGASIFEATREGVDLAKQAGRPVAFEFNGAVAVCSADSDPAEVAKRWWVLAYGKTYEQSMRER